MKSRRDPELWHATAIAVLVYLGDPRGFLVWLLDQPETDRATAGYIFFGAQGSGYLRGQTDFFGEGLSGQEWLHAMEAICRRAASSGFTNDSLGLPPGFEAERQACLDLINRGQIAVGIAVPHALLDAPFPPVLGFQFKTAFICWSLIVFLTLCSTLSCFIFKSGMWPFSWSQARKELIARIEMLQVTGDNPCSRIPITNWLKSSSVGNWEASENFP